jgi:hypothetical protein
MLTDHHNAPVIFIHSRDSDYLAYTLDCAKVFNPETRVLLLGDEKNKHYSKLGIEHAHFSDYASGDEIEHFRRVFKFVAGTEHGREWWVRFVFERWIYINNFIRENRIERFWIFDSDTLVFCDLQSQLGKFAEFDCTEQCYGMCLNGLVNRSSVVRKYVEHINRLFLDEEYLSRRRGEYEMFPKWAFTEMAAYVDFKRHANLRTARLGSVIDGETFDDCVSRPDNMESFRGRKRLFLIDGQIYTKDKASQEFIRLNTANMSWLPLSLTEKLYRYATTARREGRVLNPRILETEILIKGLGQTSRKHYRTSLKFVRHAASRLLSIGVPARG